MNFFETIAVETNTKGLRFLLIGGLAVNLYGYSRETADLDFLICFDDRDQWLKLFSGLGYSIYNDGGSFLQLSPPEKNAWPVDLMMVRKETFETMHGASKQMNLYGTNSRVPSLEHLLALKLHALKNGRMDRFLKDFLDVEHLIRINKLNIESENIRQLFAKYGTMELYEKVSSALNDE